jgi:truncated hemoglobin YjbI
MPLNLYTEINYESLTILMTRFYEKVAVDKVLAPYFFEELGDDLKSEEWLDHIELLVNFWLAKINGEDTYFGNFIGAHAKMRHIHKEAYNDWLVLFSLSSDETYIPEVSNIFKKKAFQFVRQFLTTNMKI